ncbi:MAG: translation initiation factor IF-2 [Verrucomicrobiota bacterium]|jgi:translation initiation factor IF-2
MPVRIYDIAKKVGVESKVVLAKAKELGITAAKVPSSTLDKITAEYLEELMGYKPAPPVPPPPPEPVAPAVPPVAVAPPPPPLTTPAEPTPAPEAAVVEVPPPASTEAPTPVAEIVTPPAPAPIAPPAVQPAAPPAPTAPATQVAAATPAAPTILPVVPPVATVPPAPTTVAPVAQAPAVTISSVPPPPTAAEAPPAPLIVPALPLPPPRPPVPKVGDKVGFIQLPTRPRPGERPGSRPPPHQAPGRQAPARGHDQRASGSGQRPGSPGAAQRQSPQPAPEATGDEITLKPPIIVRDLAEQLRRKPFQLIADLMELGIFATVNQSLEPEIAQRLCAKYNFRFKVEKREKGGGLVHGPIKRTEVQDADDKAEDLCPRAPVVTIMGHVDHGKTSLLDVIRKSNVAAGEAGGITQHIGAYTIAFPHPERPKELQQITFLDTPGHAAFSSMRARGANVTDIVVLVVAANDGVMPQTLEALSHAQAAKVPILVAVNKCDHPNANPLRVRQQLQEKGLVPDEWGGDTIFVDCSALTKQGVDKLLEMILLQAELLELKANPTRAAKGNVIESGLEPGGPTATVLVRKGTLRVGATVVCGQYYGKVRALINEENKRLKEAAPSVAVKLLGLNGIPEAGIEFNVVENEKLARELTEQRSEFERSQDKERRPRVTIETLIDILDEGSAKVLKLVVKADTQGSVEAIVEALQKIESDKVSLEIVHSAVGTITESDVILASASKAVILGFHTRVDTAAAELAKREGVQIKLYAIIYELIDQVKEAMAGLLDPLLKEAVFGVAEVRKVFALSKGGNVAGCVIASGRIVRGKARIMRRKNLIYEGIIHTLRRFQDEVNEVRAGMECGIRLEGFDDFQPGDTIECYNIEKVAQKL